MRYVVLMLTIFFQLPSSLAEGRETVYFCGDIASWPPYFYPVGNEWHGVDVALVSQIFRSTDINYQIHPLPWKRCLESVRHGEHYQVALSASLNNIREESYNISHSYYSLTPAYINKAETLETQEIEDITSLFAEDRRVCGIAGFNYSIFFDAKTQHLNDKLTLSAKNFPQLLDQINHDRCDIGLTRQETMLGSISLGLINWNSNLELTPFHSEKSENFFMLTSKNITDSQWLLDTLNKGIEEFYEANL